MAACFGESCQNQATSSNLSVMAFCPEQDHGRTPSGQAVDDTCSSFNQSPTVVNDQSPCEAYFHGCSEGASFFLERSPQDRPAGHTPTRFPFHIQLPGSMGVPNMWSLPQHSQLQHFPLPTLLFPSKPNYSQKRSGRSSKLSSGKRGAEEKTHTKPAKHVSLPLCSPPKRGVTATVPHSLGAADICPKDMPALEKPSFASAVSVAGHVWSLSQDSAGCLEVQDAIEAAEDEKARLGLAMELSGHVWEALQCPHANHVVRKFITTMSAPSLQFIVEELVHEGADVVREAARHRYGCRIVEMLLKTCSVEQVCEMVQNLLPDVADLSLRMYGNFVVQRILEHGTDRQRCYINQLLRANVASIASNFYGSAVVGAALRNCAHEDRVSLAQAIIGVNGLICATLRVRHNQGILEEILNVLGASHQELLQKELQAPPMKAPRSDQTFLEHKLKNKASKVSGALPQAITGPSTRRYQGVRPFKAVTGAQP